MKLLGIIAAVLIGYLGLVGADAAISRFDDPFARESLFQPGFVGFDYRTRIELIRESREKDQAVTMMVYPVHLLDRKIIPFGSVPNAVTYPCNEGAYVPFRSDKHGFTNPPEAWDDPEIILLGDSFVEGMCQPEGNRIADYLRKRYRVLNLARAGSGPLSQLGILREYGPLARPRFVLWFVTDNDLKGLQEEMKSPVLMRYLDRGFSQELAKNAHQVNKAVHDEAERIIASAKDGYPGIKVWRWIAGRQRAGREAQAPKLDIHGLSTWFRQVLEAANSDNVILVYLADYRKGAVSRRSFLPPSDSIDTTITHGDARMLHQWGIGHYTSLGNELVAEKIVDALKRRSEIQP